MNDVWNRIFKDYIKSYESIDHLAKQGITDEDITNDLFGILLKEIIETMKSEVEEDKAF